MRPILFTGLPIGGPSSRAAARAAASRQSLGACGREAPRRRITERACARPCGLARRQTRHEGMLSFYPRAAWAYASPDAVAAAAAARPRCPCHAWCAKSNTCPAPHMTGRPLAGLAREFLHTRWHPLIPTAATPFHVSHPPTQLCALSGGGLVQTRSITCLFSYGERGAGVT
ncbi:MAG: hypothetical protein J3K34DRAFT_399152 [Monoraphidium minutum]|nr:MAG: hypothetical protein J3K34DRAFT_399152 [Monoraphidium minutum]